VSFPPVSSLPFLPFHSSVSPSFSPSPPNCSLSHAKFGLIGEVRIGTESLNFYNGFVNCMSSSFLSRKMNPFLSVLPPLSSLPLLPTPGLSLPFLPFLPVLSPFPQFPSVISIILSFLLLLPLSSLLFSHHTLSSCFSVFLSLSLFSPLSFPHFPSSVPSLSQKFKLRYGICGHPASPTATYRIVADGF